MANQATTTYKVTGTKKAVSNLWNTLQCMEVNSRNIWLDDLAKHYGIDYQKKHISVRGHIYWAEYGEDEATIRTSCSGGGSFRCLCVLEGASCSLLC